MPYLLVQNLGYNGIAEFLEKVILVKEVDTALVDTQTRSLLSHLKSVTGNLPEKATPITLEEYIKEIKSLRESTYSDTSPVTPAMDKTEVMDTELREIGWRRLNLPWCTFYPTCRYHKGLDILIYKDPNKLRPRCLRHIFMFDIEAKIHNKHLGKLTTKTV